MLYFMYIIKNRYKKIENIKIKKTDKKEDLKEVKIKLYSELIDLKLAGEEGYYFLNNYELFNFNKETNKLIELVKSNESNGEDLLIAIKNLTTAYYSLNDYSRHDVDFDKESNFVYDRYLSKSNLDNICSFLPKDKEINLFYPYCKDSSELVLMKSYNDHITTYGLTKAHKYKSANTNTDHLIRGLLSGSRIQNEAFDTLFLKPDIDLEMTIKNQIVYVNEKEIIKNTFKYLRPNGVGFIIVPYFRLYKDVCLQISKYLKNIQIYNLNGKDFFDNQYIIIIGEKKENKEPDNDVYNLLRKININKQKQIIDCTEPLTIPEKIIDITIFRGSVLDMEEIKIISKKSDCYNDFWENQKSKKIYENNKNPLLPFNTGQIGLVLTSGCLDGIIEEENGFCHAIKGQVVKDNAVSTNSDGKMTERQEIISNKVEITVLLPNGEIKTLA